MKNNKRNILIVTLLLEIIGFIFCIRNGIESFFIYYTQLSNLITTISIILILLSKKENNKLINLRYLSTCMLLMTSLITIFVLVPSGEFPLSMLIYSPIESGLYFHVLCPILSIYSFLKYEPKIKEKRSALIPIILTSLYGIIMIFLNIFHIVDGPYPFLKVYDQSIMQNILWNSFLLIFISSISYTTLKIKNK